MSEVTTFDPEVEKRLREVTEKFNKFIAQQKTELIRSKEEYTKTLKQLRNEYKDLDKSIQELTQRELELNSAIDHEIKEANSSEAHLGELRMREKQLQDERKSLENQVNELRAKVQEKRDEFSNLKTNQQLQEDTNLPEALVYERLLGFQIEGIKDDLLKLVFRNVNTQDTNQEYSLNLDVGSHIYKVDNVTPEIPEEILTRIVKEFNETRDLTHFLKNIRHEFKSLT